MMTTTMVVVMMMMLMLMLMLLLLLMLLLMMMVMVTMPLLMMMMLLCLVSQRPHVIWRRRRPHAKHSPIGEAKATPHARSGENWWEAGADTVPLEEAKATPHARSGKSHTPRSPQSLSLDGVIGIWAGKASRSSVTVCSMMRRTISL